MKQPEELMTIASWERGDSLPALPRIPGLSVDRCCDDREMALLQGSFEGVVPARRAAGNVPYVARISGEAVGYIWVATGLVHICPFGLSFSLGEDERYLWDVTLLAAGRPYRPCAQILQAVLKEEPAERFWIGVGPETVADVERAGFGVAGHLYREDGAARLAPAGDGERPEALSKLLDLPMTAPSAGSPRPSVVAA